jgi:hypothetical protein
VWQARLEQGRVGEATDALERSRNLYWDGFKKVPTDTYVGINAAAKSALLGEMDVAKRIAGEVLTRLAEKRTERGGGPATDYWERATEPEALLIQGSWAEARRLYHEARIAHQHEAGSIAATGTQVERLLGVLDVPADVSLALRAEFGLRPE